MQYAPTEIFNMLFRITIFQIKKRDRAVSPNNLSIQIEKQSIPHDHFSDQKEGHTISHNQKIDLRNRSFLPSG